MTGRIVTLEAAERVDQREFAYFKDDRRGPEMLRAHVIVELGKALGHELVKRKLIDVTETIDAGPAGDHVTFRAKVHVCEPGTSPELTLIGARQKLAGTVKARAEQLADPLYVPPKPVQPVDLMVKVREVDAFVLDLLTKMLPETSGRFALGVVANKLKTILEAA